MRTSPSVSGRQSSPTLPAPRRSSTASSTTPEIISIEGKSFRAREAEEKKPRGRKPEGLTAGLFRFPRILVSADRWSPRNALASGSAALSPVRRSSCARFFSVGRPCVWRSTKGNSPPKKAVFWRESAN